MTAHPNAHPTVVLVHGAFADSSSWNDVIRHLHASGHHKIVTLANPLRGLASDAAYLGDLLDTISGPVVLVGHSYGGCVITEAAADRPNVKGLVYIAAFIPEVGESAAELAEKFPGSTLGSTLTTAPFTLPDGRQGTDLYIGVDSYHDQFAIDVPEHETAVLALTQRPIAASALQERATRAGWRGARTWALIATLDRNIPPAAQRFMAERAQAQVVEVAASHAAAVSRPSTTGYLIEEAVAAALQA